MTLAIDPGPTQSAWINLDDDGRPERWAIDENLAIADWLRVRASSSSDIVIEMIASYGMAVGKEVFETCLWIGRFIQAAQPAEVKLIYRRDVKLRLCNSVKAKDGNIRQRLIDLYGGKDVAIGRKAKPGPLYGIKSHLWAALAVAVAHRGNGI